MPHHLIEILHIQQDNFLVSLQNNKGDSMLFQGRQKRKKKSLNHSYVYFYDLITFMYESIWYLQVSIEGARFRLELELGIILSSLENNMCSWTLSHLSSPSYIFLDKF